MSPYVVSTAWLAERLNAPDISIIDASWHLPAAKRNAKAEFLAGHIPGAQFFDIDAEYPIEETFVALYFSNATGRAKKKRYRPGFPPFPKPANWLQQ